MSDDPVAVDLNVDAALLLKDLVGIDSYPAVLGLMPNIYRLEDRDRVHAVVAEELAEAGILGDDGVHPAVAQWLQCLYRPDMELVAHILDVGEDGVPGTMLLMSFVRSGDVHVLAVRCGDHVVIQPVFQEGEQLDTVAAAVTAALGPAPALRFDPVAAPLEQIHELASESDERRRDLLELGAQPHTAGMLTRVLNEVVRRAEVVLVEHRDGGSAQTEVCLNVLDTPSGRIVVTPSMAMDGQVWSTYAPGDEAAIRGGIAALLELLPGRSWFETSRTG
ncbi:ESX secretion-associated protein EspG [Nocardia mexicana]|uniref:ESAT-6 protein secretion system EspG family protein n=1 Tax=Nocardia mexicana TaxID=279262 RepID=A0A370HC61_9NOCA|nr:ESX secretion-associated protein EspG [Nocardia mexicana]RDI54533.1 ESAT-6 protein secretion system EspG family protein [Nocardia mexicana]